MCAADSQEFDRELEAAKLRALAEFAAGAGHEINNPIATIVGYVQQLLAGERDPDRRHALATIGGQALRIRDMIGDVMLFARPPQPRPIVQNLTEVVGEITGKFADEAKSAGCRIELRLDEHVSILADPTQLRVVISNLVRNSLEAIDRDGEVVITAASELEGERRLAVLTVADNGRGLSIGDREHMFDPFYSGRQAGRGLGFGLSKCWQIVTLHGGRIDVISPEAGGATLIVRWPAEPAPPDIESR